MNSLTAMIFPDTVPAADQLFPLVLVFQSIVYCQPVERDEKGQNPGFTAKDALPRHFPCEMHVPAPLGPDLDRFLRLQNDLRHRGDDYAAQLGHLSLAGMADSQRPANESKTSILSGLLQTQGIEHRDRERRDLILWQARLVLKLGELLDEEQAQLDAELARLNAKQNELLSELRQDAELPFSLTEQLSLGSTKHDGLRNLRLKAWARLYALGEPIEPGTDALITVDRDALHSLFDEYEKITGEQPVELTSVQLPAQEGSDTDMAAAQQLFQEQAGEKVTTLRTMIKNPSTAAEQDRTLFAAPDGEWAVMLEKALPAATHGRRLLKLYHFANTQAEPLLLNTFGRDSEYRPEEMEKKGNGVVIGLLE